jgi:hypothetical protein
MLSVYKKQRRKKRAFWPLIFLPHVLLQLLLQPQLQHIWAVRVVLAQGFESAADDAFPRWGFGGGGHGCSPAVNVE